MTQNETNLVFNLKRVIELHWTFGQYAWAVEQYVKYGRDYLTPNGFKLGKED